MKKYAYAPQQQMYSNADEHNRILPELDTDLLKQSYGYQERRSLWGSGLAKIHLHSGFVSIFW